MDFSQTPFIAIWETTQACDLACVHCRAEAQPLPLPGELTHGEGLALINEIAELGTKVLVLSGGDPLKRADLLDLIRHGKSRGLRMATIPAATPLLDRGAVDALKAAGLDQMALSLDAATPEDHDRFRGAAGAFEKTVAAIQWAHDVELPVQINSVMSRHNVDDVDRLVELVRGLGIVFWEVFFLVPVGRGAQLPGLSAEQYEQVFAKLYHVAQQVRFIVKITEAPHFRRYYYEQRLQGPSGTIGQAPLAVNAGKGFVFIAYNGEVYPSGFLPLSCGNIRRSPLRTIYQTSPLMQALRDPNRLKGRCGVCEYRAICGGSRSRAYALTGDPLAEEPCCAYQPLAFHSA
ncbi:MAG: TIGR04053 family radical SAM/SPASM domain-containing protein [Candidatus Omnitrophica bacterium]|nr:TIGR04053 family radical SAM/SPASM domain-containing protein [Candidatus Omnitrophota bacterium]